MESVGSKIFLRPVGRLLCVLFLIFGSACSGGSKGTGTQTFEGRVVTSKSEPAAGVTVTLVDTGDSDVTDDQGFFSIISILLAGDLPVAVDTDQFSSTVIVTGVPEAATRVNVTIQLNEETEEAELDEVSIEHEQKEKESGLEDQEHSSESAESNSQEQSGAAVNSGEQESSGSGSSKPGTQEIETEGIISTVQVSSISVNGLVFQINSTTRIKDSHGQIISASDLAPGDRVSIHGSQQSGQNIAFEIERKNESSTQSGGDSDDEGSEQAAEGEAGESEGFSNQGAELEAEGRVTAVSGSGLTVGTKSFVYNSQTIFKDKEEHPVSSSYFQIGMNVHVQGYAQSGKDIAALVKEED